MRTIEQRASTNTKLFEDVPEARRRNMRAIRSLDTAPERVVRSALHRLVEISKADETPIRNVQPRTFRQVGVYPPWGRPDEVSPIERLPDAPAAFPGWLSNQLPGQTGHAKFIRALS